MTDYTKSTNFATKDSLPPGSALKIVRGTEIDTEFNSIATAVATKADSSSVTTSLALKADLASPALTGSPTAPTPTAGDNDTSIATTAFVSTAVSTAVATAVNNVGYPAFKNRIINGAMVIDQRNAGAAVTVNSSSVSPYVTDRFYCTGQTSDGVFTAQQSAIAPAGFNNSLKFTVTTADASIGATQRYEFTQVIEGFNFADFNFGSANAKTFTLSFWIRASVTGTYGGAFVNEAANRSYVFSYTITAADTWEYKTITVAGDTTGTWTGATNGYGLRVYWSLGEGSTYQTTAGSWTSGFYLAPTGQTNLIATVNATMYITGVQLEKGSTATSFDYRPYGTELALCQRYYESISYASGTEGIVMGFVQTSTVARYAFPIVAKRATPTIAYSGTLAVEYGTGSTTNVTGTSSQAYGGGSVASLYFSVASGLTSGQACCLYANGTTVYVTFSSEL